MPAINRRKALTVTGGALAAGLAATVASVQKAPGAELEAPWVKARRLARELSEVPWTQTPWAELHPGIKPPS
jgi:hypothetical protein